MEIFDGRARSGGDRSVRKLDRKVLNGGGGRAFSSVLSRDKVLRMKFSEKHGDRYRTVRD